MKRAETLPSLNPPEDPLITTLYIGGLGDEAEANPITEQDLRNHFYQYGEIRQVTVVAKQGCAFIQVISTNNAVYIFIVDCSDFADLPLCDSFNLVDPRNLAIYEL